MNETPRPWCANPECLNVLVFADERRSGWCRGCQPKEDPVTTHDPLCPMSDAIPTYTFGGVMDSCTYCPTIARVRADDQEERERDWALAYVRVRSDLSEEIAKAIEAQPHACYDRHCGAQANAAQAARVSAK